MNVKDKKANPLKGVGFFVPVEEVEGTNFRKMATYYDLFDWDESAAADQKLSFAEHNTN